MKKTRLAMVVAASALFASPVVAASLTMVQFGSFETREEAQDRLKKITSKYGATVGKLPSNIREIKLPPDNLTVYRTQAGPVENRAAAQAICSELSAKGDECYIVETAAAAAPTAPTVESSASTALASASPVAASSSLLTSPVEPTAPDVTSKLSTLKESDLALRDGGNRAALASVAAPSVLGGAADVKTVGADGAVSALAPQSTDPVSASAVAAPLAVSSATSNAPSPALVAALDKAAKEQEAAAVAPVAEKSAEVKKEGGFWSRLNPFGSSRQAKEATPKAAPKAVAAPVIAAPAIEAVSETPLVESTIAATKAAPITDLPAAPTITAAPLAPSRLTTPRLVTPTLTTPSLEPKLATTEIDVPASTAIAPAIARAPDKPVAQGVETAALRPEATATSRPIILDTTPVIKTAEPLPLPPPPAPLNEADRKFLAASVATRNQPRLDPISTGTIAPPSSIAVGTLGTVGVGEPIIVPPTRVPGAGLAPPTIANASPLPTPRLAVVPPLNPTPGAKANWAQIGPFASNEEALAFWANYRQNHPDFPVVRVRASSPYLQQSRGVRQSFLKVGPMASSAFIGSLCASLNAQASLRCGAVDEAADLSTGGAPATGSLLPASRYAR